MTGKKGAPKGNTNGLRHGLYGSRLPKGCGYILKAINAFRRSLEEAVRQAKGELSLVDIATIQSAYRWERHAQLCQRWLAVTSDLQVADRVNLSREIARASSERDKNLRALGLASDTSATVLDALYRHPAGPKDADEAAGPATPTTN